MYSSAVCSSAFVSLLSSNETDRLLLVGLDVESGELVLRLGLPGDCLPASLSLSLCRSTCLSSGVGRACRSDRRRSRHDAFAAFASL